MGTVAMVYAILIGGLIVSVFLTLSGGAMRLAEIIGNLPLLPWQVIVLMVVFYGVLGMFVDGVSLLVLT
ncbi:unnamed protein product, partial [marine sediment metagenome]